jgi:hypothetical protein
VLLSPKGFCLACEVTVEFNFKSELDYSLGEIGEINVFMNTKTNCAGYF